MLEPNIRKVHLPYSLLISTTLLQLDGVTLDNFAELKTVEGLKEGSLIKVSPVGTVLQSVQYLNMRQRIFILQAGGIVVNTQHVE